MNQQERLFPEQPAHRKREVPKYDIPPDTRPSTCNGPNCRAKIYMVKTGTGWKPLDPDGTLHFYTCPDRDLFSRKRRKG